MIFLIGSAVVAIVAFVVLASANPAPDPNIGWIIVTLVGLLIAVGLFASGKVRITRGG